MVTSNRIHLMAEGGEHLRPCMAYIDLNMVRAEAVVGELGGRGMREVGGETRQGLSGKG